LAALLSESGYKGKYLKEIVEQTARSAGGDSFAHQNDVLRPFVPESNEGYSMACCLCVISVLGPIVCLGKHALARGRMYASGPRPESDRDILSCVDNHD
jgi:hypothetical protein